MDELRLWGRHLYERQDVPLAWAGRVLAAAAATRPGLPGIDDVLDLATDPARWPHAQQAFRQVRQQSLDSAADEPTRLLYALAEVVAKLAHNTSGRQPLYDLDVGERIGPLAHRLAAADPELRERLGSALGGMPDGPYGDDSLIGDLATELLAPAAARRVEALGRLLEWASFGNEPARAALRTVVVDHRRYSREIYTRALNRVALFGDTDLEQPLLRALADREHGCELWAATACADLGFRAAVPLITRLLTDRADLGDLTVLTVEGACLALGRLGAVEAVPSLIESLDDPSATVCAGAAAALADIGGEQALAALWRALESRRHPRAGYLASALAGFGPLVVDDLIAMASHRDPDLRYWACRALGATADDRALPVLERLAEHDLERTGLGGRVATAARQGLRTAHRIRSRRPASPPVSG